MVNDLAVRQRSYWIHFYMGSWELTREASELNTLLRLVLLKHFFRALPNSDHFQSGEEQYAPGRHV